MITPMIPQLLCAHIGGSRVYGTPRPDSDLDIVVLVNETAVKEMRATADSSHVYDDSGSTSFRFGKLNLIAITDPVVYQKWADAYNLLIMEAVKSPVSKKRACEVHQQTGATLPRKNEYGEDMPS